MDILKKQVVWFEQKPLFEAEFIHSHLLPSFNFNENTGDYEIKSQCLNNIDDEDRKVAYETLNTGWVMWLRAKRGAKAQAVPEGFVLVKKELPEQIAEKMAIDRIDKPRHENDLVWSEIAEQSYKDQVKSKKWEFWRDYKAMIEAQESSHD